MGHVEDRAKERTTLTEADIAKARAYVKANRKQFKKDQTYSIVAPNRKGYYIVGDVGKRRKKHVIKTVYGANMRPPGTIIQNAKLEHDLIKAADALFSLEKTASAISYSVALMEYDKLASAYFGYELDEWLEYPEEMRKEALVNWARGVNAAGNRALSKVYNRLGWEGGSRRAAAASSQSYSNLAKNKQMQAMKTTNVDKATRLQTQAADDSINASRQATMAGNAERATQQAEHANRQLGVAERNIAADPTKVTQNATNAVNNAGQAFERKITAPAVMNQTPATVKPTAVGNQAKVPAQPNANTGGGGTTGSTPPPPPPPPAATDASNPINWQNVGYGALGTTALAGGGYGGYLMGRNNPQQQMGMPKMASWHSFVAKTASYSDALGMYKEALSRADRNLLREYKKSNEQEKAAEVQYRGRTFPGYNKPMQSDRPNKKKMVLAKKGDQVKLVHYGHTGYKHNYSKGAKKNYLTRSAGIRNKSGELTMNDKFSANYWARRDLWPQGQKADGSDKKR